MQAQQLKVRDGQKTVRLDDILENEDLIFIDTHIRHASEDSWYRDYMYKPSRFAKLDTNMLVSFIGEIRELEQWIDNPKVYTVETAVAEHERFKGILNNKLIFLQKSERHYDAQRTSKRYQRILHVNRHSYKHPKAVRLTDEGRRVMEELCLCYNRLCHRAAKATPRDSDRKKFESVMKLVKSVAANTYAKRRYDYRYDTLEVKSSPRDLGADEELVSAGLYHAIFENCSNALVSHDSDIWRLTANSVAYVAASNINGSEELTERIKNHPIYVYFAINTEEAVFALDTNNLFATPGFPSSYIGKYLRPMARPVSESVANSGICRLIAA